MFIRRSLLPSVTSLFVALFLVSCGSNPSSSTESSTLKPKLQSSFTMITYSVDNNEEIMPLSGVETTYTLTEIREEMAGESEVYVFTPDRSTESPIVQAYHANGDVRQLYVIPAIRGGENDSVWYTFPVDQSTRRDSVLLEKTYSDGSSTVNLIIEFRAERVGPSWLNVKDTRFDAVELKADFLTTQSAQTPGKTPKLDYMRTYFSLLYIPSLGAIGRADLMQYDATGHLSAGTRSEMIRYNIVR